MFRVVGHTAELASRLLLDEYYVVNIEWGESNSANHVYWQLSADKNMLMLGINRESGFLASVATPLAEFEYDADRVFLFVHEKIDEGIPIFDVSRFITENRSAKNDNNIVTETLPFSMIVGSHQILIEFQSTSEVVSCICSERATFYVDQNGFVTKILCALTDKEMIQWKSYHLLS